MKTDSFLASLIFPSDGKISLCTVYNERRKSNQPVEVTPNERGGNFFYKKECHFLAFSFKNKKVMRDELADTNGLITEHVVSNENAEYQVVAFLEEDGEIETNTIELVTTLPIGLGMKRIEVDTDFAVFVFSGLSVMLFDTVPSSENNKQT